MRLHKRGNDGPTTFVYRSTSHGLSPRALICMKDLCIYQNVLYRGKGLAR